MGKFPILNLLKSKKPLKPFSTGEVPLTTIDELTAPVTKPDIQTVKENVNLDLDMGDINLIGDKRVTSCAL